MSALPLACRETGAGAPVVLLHGIGGSARVWRPLGSALDGHCLLAYDLPGHGDARAPERAFTLAELAEAVRADLTSRDVVDAVLCGHSIGALLVLLIALEEPTLASRLVLIATDPGPAAFGWLAGGFVPELARTQGMEAVFDYAVEHDATMAPLRHDPAAAASYRRAFTRVDAHGYAALAEAVVARPDLTRRLGELDKPTLVVCGGADDAFVAPSRALAEATGGRYVEVPGAGHLPMLDDPDLVAREIRVLAKGR